MKLQISELWRIIKQMTGISEVTSQNTPKSQGPGRPKDMEKRAAILAAAKRLFTRQSFRGTSMDAVASAAGVSKLTVYSHFGDKANLFREVVREWMQEFLPETTYELDTDLDIRGNLLRVARTHARLDCSREAVGTFRAIISDCPKGVPRYGRLIWEEGALRTHALVEGLLRDAITAGWLEIEDVPRAAVQFMVLIQGDMKMRRLFGCVECDEAYAIELEDTAKAGVEMFLRAYRPR